jgi:hypothetical protein
MSSLTGGTPEQEREAIKRDMDFLAEWAVESFLGEDKFTGNRKERAWRIICAHREALDVIDALRADRDAALRDCVTLAKLAADTPQFSSPLVAFDALNRRDFYLRQAAASLPDAVGGSTNG